MQVKPCYEELTAYRSGATLMPTVIIYIMISSIACVSYLFLGISVLVFGKNSAIHKSFVALCAILALWSIGSVGQELFQHNALASLFDKIYYTGSELFILAGIIFVMFLTGSWKSRVLVYIFLLVVSRMTIYQIANWGWNLLAKAYPTGFWFVSHQLFSVVEVLFMIVIVAIWGKKTTLYRERAQAKIVVFSTLGGTIIGVLVDFFSGAHGYNPISNTIPLLWVSAICFAIIRYGLLQFSPLCVNRNLIEHMDQAVFVIDVSWNITDLNSAALFLLEYQEAPNSPLPMKEVFLDSFSIIKKLQAVMNSGNTFYSQSDYILTLHKNSIQVVANYSIVNDSWGDMLGILAICYPQIDLRAFIDHYKLSERQTDILRHIISGRSQTQTAEALFISLPTVKTHTTSLYNRLGISSRSELYALLRGENLKDSDE